MDLNNLKTLAQAATRGGWKHKKFGVIVAGPFRQYTNGSAQSQIASFGVTGSEDIDEPDKQLANADFAAAADPEAVLELISLVERQEAELAAARSPAQRSTRPMSDENARYAIEEVISRGKAGTHKPPTADHWLMPFWEIGQQLAAPATEQDLLDIVRSLLSAVDRKAEVGENYPSPTAEGRPWMIAARRACVERGFTAGGLSVDGAAPALPTPAAPEGWQPIKTAPRDGRNILVRFGQDGASQAKYIPGLPRPWQFIDTNNGISWMVNAAADGAGGPSCWMPMPGDASPRGAA